MTTTYPDTESAVSLTLSLLHSGQMLLKHSPDVTAACFYSKQHHTYTTTCQYYHYYKQPFCSIL